MANGFGSLYVGSSGLRAHQNAMNVVANNLSNIDTTGYVRQQVIFEDMNYNFFARASISDQYTGLGVSIGDVIHARDQFLDQSYRLESGRAAFYASQYDATSEVETLLKEIGTGESFATAVHDLYEAFAEFAKDPSDTVHLNLVSQKASLFISRAQGVYDGLKSYQTNLNSKINNDIERINEIGKQIYNMNLEIQKIEAGGTETAMTLRDERDALLDELGKLAKISYKESPDHIVSIKLEGVDFVLESQHYSIGSHLDRETGFVVPYWDQLSEPAADEYYEVFNTAAVDAVSNNDVGEVKSLLLARGNRVANYMDIINLNPYQYENGISNSVMLNTEAELDSMVHSLVVAINDLLSPVKNYSETAYYKSTDTLPRDDRDADGKVTAQYPLVTKNEQGETVNIYTNTKVLDVGNVIYGSDGELPPHELFSRNGCERYTRTTDDDGNVYYVYNEEKPEDTSTCYTIKSLSVNKDVVEDSSVIPHIMQNGDIAYTMAEDIYNLWEDKNYILNPNDTTPCSYSEFYTKFVGDLSTKGSIYKTTSESLKGTVETIESNRQAVVGVSADEELTNLIKFQNAYNASSRYINTVSQMIDYLLSSLS